MVSEVLACRLPSADAQRVRHLANERCLPVSVFLRGVLDAQVLNRGAAPSPTPVAAGVTWGDIGQR